MRGLAWSQSHLLEISLRPPENSGKNNASSLPKHTVDGNVNICLHISRPGIHQHKNVSPTSKARQEVPGLQVVQNTLLPWLQECRV